ncbi:DEKNAAC101934 [Brettanomyces naardenensis]|uniref:DEKNAAC101934 n=1 Tax=Brettanomyces naardenensis TaxID=13370 RepID=A0A448YJE0_BRENA|nr:DEKNAAC101934 [Brettanomyces naardenensis]
MLDAEIIELDTPVHGRVCDIELVDLESSEDSEDSGDLIGIHSGNNLAVSSEHERPSEAIPSLVDNEPSHFPSPIDHKPRPSCQSIPSSPPTSSLKVSYIHRARTARILSLDTEEEESRDNEDLIIVGENKFEDREPLTSDLSDFTLSATKYSSHQGSSLKIVAPNRRRGQLYSDISTISSTTNSDSVVIEELTLGHTVDAKNRMQRTVQPAKEPKGSGLKMFKTQKQSVQSSARVISSSLQHDVSRPHHYTDSELSAMLESAKKNDPKTLKQVNVTSKTKPELMSQMIVSFETSVMSRLKEVNSKFTDFLDPLNYSSHMDPNDYPTIRFQRKINSVYFAEKGTFIPVDSHIEEEDMVGLYIDSKELPEMFQDHSFGEMIRAMRKQYVKCGMIVFLLEYDSFLQGLKTKLNKEYVNKVRLEMSQETETDDNNDCSQEPKKKRRKRKPLEQSSPKYTANQIDSRLLKYEIDYDIHFFPIKGIKDLVEWLKSLSYTVSCRYFDKLERNIDFSNVGQVRSGKDAKDSFVEMLKQFKFVTPSTAKRIVEEAGITSISDLMDKLESGKKLINSAGRNIIRSDADTIIRKVLLSEDSADLI